MMAPTVKDIVMMNSKKNRNKKLIVRMPRFCLWLGITGTLFFGGIIVGMILFPNDTVTLWTYFVFGLFLLGGLLFFLD